MYLELSKLLEANKIMPKMQFGFRKGRSTKTVLHDIIDHDYKVFNAQDPGKRTALLLLDYYYSFRFY